MRVQTSHHIIAILAFVTAAAFAVLAPRDVPSSASAQEDPPPPVMPATINITDVQKDGKLVGPLATVAEGVEPPPETSGVVQAAGGVVVLVDTTIDAREAAAELSAGGMHVGEVSPELNIVQGRIPAHLLDDLAALPSVARIRPTERPILNATTEGDAILDANDLRTTYAANGAGVRVGVISDGLEGLAAAQGAGELPAVNSTTCDAVGFAPAGQPANPTDAGAGAEGTAMLEIVHDMAPGAELWFGYFGFNVTTATTLDYMQAVDCLAANVDVIVDNVTYLNNGLYDGTSAVSQDIAAELNAPANRVRGYYNAVGSVARQHYQELYVDSGFTITAGTNVWNMHRFQATASTTDGGQGAQCAANPAFGYCGDRVFLPPDGLLRVGLQWDDPWGASANDYDVFLLNETTAQFFLINPNEQNGNDNPVEEFAWQNTTAATQPLSIFIGRFSGVPKTFDMFVLCEDCTPIAGSQHNFNTLSSSVMNNADAGGGVMALGAINADDPGNDDIAPYSSRGPTNDLRTKPDATAIDKVTVSGAGGFDVPFVGTSAAAPHGGAIAALLLSCQPSLKSGEPGDNPAADRTSLRNALTSSAVDLGTPGADNTFGAGRLDADAAAAVAGCAPDADGDGVAQLVDNCPADANPGQENSDKNFIDNSPPYASTVDDKTLANSDTAGDACDTDDDNDGRTDGNEASGAGCAAIATNATLRDTDGDRFLDGAECALGSNPSNAASFPAVAACGTTADPDGDKITSRIETCFYNTSNASADTDGDAPSDGAKDGCEIASLNGDRIVSSIDQGMLAQGISGSAGYTVNVDINKDGVLSSIDQGIMASFIVPSGQCP